MNDLQQKIAMAETLIKNGYDSYEVTQELNLDGHIKETFKNGTKALENIKEVMDTMSFFDCSLDFQNFIINNKAVLKKLWEHTYRDKDAKITLSFNNEVGDIKCKTKKDALKILNDYGDDGLPEEYFVFNVNADKTIYSKTKDHINYYVARIDHGRMGSDDIQHHAYQIMNAIISNHYE